MFRNKILSKTNNIKLGNKLVLLFLVCVLIPLITTNICILWSLQSGMNREQVLKTENIADCLEFELRDSIRQQISIADYLNRNGNLQRFLKKRYQSPAQYYGAYVQLVEDDVIQYYYTAFTAHNIVICTKNDTITNGTYFVRQDDMEQTGWYRAFEENGRKLCMYSYFENGEESLGYIKKGRQVVIMQELNYCGEGNMVMLELGYQPLSQQMMMLCDDIPCYISDGDKVLFSTQETDGWEKDFLPLEQFEEAGYTVTRKLDLYGKELVIHLKPNHYQVFDSIWEQKGAMLLLYTVNLLVPSAFIYLLYRSLHDRVAMTQQYLERMEEGVYEAIPSQEGTDEIGSMIQSYNYMALRIKELIEVVFKNKERQQSLELSKKQAELQALQSQLNPHFIFNALESIRMHSILKKEEEIARILENFAVLMRKNIQWDKDFVTIEEECDNVKRYLEIQKYRFGKRMEYYLHIQKECLAYEIPKFIIITFVENACVHGIEKSVGGGSVTVMVSEDEASLYFEIMDQGGGMGQEELKQLQDTVEQAGIEYIQKAKKSIGIVNAVVRMRQYYGTGVQIDINSTEQEGTEVCIQLPKVWK